MKPKFNKDYFEERVDALLKVILAIEKYQKESHGREYDDEDVKNLIRTFYSGKITYKMLIPFQTYLINHNGCEGLLHTNPFTLSPYISIYYISKHIVEHFESEFNVQKINEDRAHRILLVLECSCVGLNDARCIGLKMLLNKSGFKGEAIRKFCERIPKTRESLVAAYRMAKEILNKFEPKIVHHTPEEAFKGYRYLLELTLSHYDEPKVALNYENFEPTPLL